MAVITSPNLTRPEASRRVGRESCLRRGASRHDIDHQHAIDAESLGDLILGDLYYLFLAVSLFRNE